eukprot:scaffold18204_cov104-Skeletonema_marinoi.AAC.1
MDKLPPIATEEEGDEDEDIQQVLLAVLQATTNSVEETSLSTAEKVGGIVRAMKGRPVDV